MSDIHLNIFLGCTVSERTLKYLRYAVSWIFLVRHRVLKCFRLFFSVLHFRLIGDLGNRFSLNLLYGFSQNFGKVLSRQLFIKLQQEFELSEKMAVVAGILLHTAGEKMSFFD